MKPEKSGATLRPNAEDASKGHQPFGMPVALSTPNGRFIAMANFEQRRSADGTVTHRVKVRLKGHPPVTASFARLTDARRWAQETEVSIRQGRYFKTAEAAKHTLGDLVDRYLEEGFADRLKSGNDRRRHLLAWKAMVGSTMLSDLTPAVIAACRTKMLAEKGTRKAKLSPSTVNRHFAALSHALRVAVFDWQWLDDSPMRKVSKLREPRGRIRFLSDVERERLLNACRSSASTVLYPIVVLAISTGMRRGELLGMRWPLIDLAAGQIRLEDTKNDTPRSVPLAGHAKDLLAKLSKVRRLDTDLVFPSNGPDKRKPIDITQPWTTAVRRAGLQDLRFHDLRHTCASYLAQNGTPTVFIANILGHKTLAMVKRYSHLAPSHAAAEITKMNESIFGKGITAETEDAAA